MILSAIFMSWFSASGGFAPRPPPGLRPWTPLGDFRPPDPLSFAPATSESWRRHCRAVFWGLTPCVMTETRDNGYVNDKLLKRESNDWPLSSCGNSWWSRVYLIDELLFVRDHWTQTEHCPVFVGFCELKDTVFEITELCSMCIMMALVHRGCYSRKTLVS